MIDETCCSGHVNLMTKQTNHDPLRYFRLRHIISGEYLGVSPVRGDWEEGSQVSLIRH